MGMETKLIKDYIKRGSLVLGMVFCSFVLYRLLPSFSVYRSLSSILGFLVSSSPIIICTAVLLRTLLAFGQQPNIPQVKEEENQTPVRSLRTRSVADDSLGEINVATVEEKAIKEAGFGKGIEEVLITKRSVNEENWKEINGEKAIEIENRGNCDDFESHSNDQYKEISYQQVKVHTDSDTESSSSDVSAADVMPVLDELHPLIETEAPIPPLTHQDHVSDAQESVIESADSVGGVKSADEVDSREKAATRAEDNAKNFMDIGNFGFERNLRLENLIAKRRARKKWMALAERNLMDINGNDSDETMGSPIPGSAPSVMAPRFNPFGLAYEVPDERRNPEVENSGQQAVVVPPPRDMLFRRYETFNLGAAHVGEMKQQEHDVKFTPFEPERRAIDTTFSNQFSKRSYSKPSSIPKTDVVSSSSGADQDDNRELLRKELPQIGELSSVSNNVYKRLGKGNESSEVDLSKNNVSKPLDVIGEFPNDAQAFEKAKVDTANQGEGVEGGQVEEPVMTQAPVRN